MEHIKKSKKNFKTFKIIFLILIIVSIIIIGIKIINKSASTDVENADSTIIGTFSYEDGTKFKFEKDGKGAMYIEKDKFDYSYKTEGNKLIIDFVDEKVHDATYSYQIENDTLKLVGEDGPAGGEYTLKKE